MLASCKAEIDCSPWVVIDELMGVHRDRFRAALIVWMLRRQKRTAPSSRCIPENPTDDPVIGFIHPVALRIPLNWFFLRGSIPP